MHADIRICRAHDRPVYTLSDVCPKCDEPTANSAPAPFDPDDPYGEYRRKLKRRERE
ncbi:RNA-protein complex protein Nop10 [Halarchaeum salinum]|uniref:Ribosome biogenesis protein Nop10 n=1 Tax=Halarchaeum salinum TaxID=489912 RepID=A0AAV3SAP2_9EURY